MVCRFMIEAIVDYHEEIDGDVAARTPQPTLAVPSIVSTNVLVNTI